MRLLALTIIRLKHKILSNEKNNLTYNEAAMFLLNKIKEMIKIVEKDLESMDENG